MPSVPLLTAPGDKTPIIADLKPGRYEASSLAVGEEKDLARQRGEGLGFVPSGTLQRYLTGVRARLLTASGVTGVPGKVIILANPAFAAYSTPDGNVYIGMGWLPFLETEDEIAAIIAHELAHVLLTHHSADLVVGFQKRAQSAQELGIGAKMAVQKTAAPTATEQQALLGSQLLTGVADKVVMPAWGRRQEREADLLGVDLLVKAGYSPIAMVSMLEKYRAWEAKTKQADDDYWTRVQTVARNDVTEALKLSLNRVVEELSVSHPDTGKRIEDAAAYIDRHYGESPLPSPNTAAWNDIKRNPDVRETTRNYDMAFSARKLLEQGKAADAYAYAKASASGRTGTDAYPNWILAKSAMATRRPAEAVTALDRAIKANEPVREVYDEIIFVHEQRGQIDAALGWTDRASTVFGDAHRWMPTKIRLLRRAGRVNDASALALKCSLDAPDWRKLCQEANQVPAGRAAR